MRTIKLFALVTGTGAGIVSYTVPRTGFILAIAASAMCRTAAPAAGAWIQTEVSLTNVNNCANSGCEGVLMETKLGNPFTTSGGMCGQANTTLQGIKIPIRQGDILYLNATVNGALSVDSSYVIMFSN